MPPIMPFIHDALWFGVFAGLALFGWRMAQRFDLRLTARNLHLPFGQAVTTSAPTWFTTTTTRSSGNTAFDDWRDGEMARIEAQRQALATRLQDFETFLDKLRRAKDRETFDRFMAQFREMPDDRTS